MSIELKRKARPMEKSLSRVISISFDIATCLLNNMISSRRKAVKSTSAPATYYNDLHLE